MGQAHYKFRDNDNTKSNDRFSGSKPVRTRLYGFLSTGIQYQTSKILSTTLYIHLLPFTLGTTKFDILTGKLNAYFLSTYNTTYCNQPWFNILKSVCGTVDDADVMASSTSLLKSYEDSSRSNDRTF